MSDENSTENLKTLAGSQQQLCLLTECAENSDDSVCQVHLSVQNQLRGVFTMQELFWAGSFLRDGSFTEIWFKNWEKTP